MANLLAIAASTLVPAAAAPATGRTGPSTAASLIGALFPFLVMLVVFYFFLMRPQQEQEKRRRKMLGELKKGDRVITTGGIHGQITDVKNDTLTVRIADKVEVQLSRAAVQAVKK